MKFKINENEKYGWQILYDYAYKFSELAPWNWIKDSDIFGIQNPKNEEIYYCSIMGQGGISYGIILFEGTKGLELLNLMLSGACHSADEKVLRDYNLLHMAYYDKNSLEDIDLKFLKELNIINKYEYFPIFRSFEAGYIPWILNMEEIEFFAFAIEEILDICMKYKNNIDLILPKKGSYFVRKAKFEKGKIIREDRFEIPKKIAKIENQIIFNELKLQKIKRNSKKSNLIWEADISDYPEILIKEDEKPFFPSFFILVDRESFFILKTLILSPKDLKENFAEEFLDAFSIFGTIPKELHIKSKKYFEFFEAITEKLGIKLIIEKRLPTLEKVKRDMMRVVKGRKF